VSKIDLNEKLEYFKPNELYLGLTYGQWTVEWWRWALGLSKRESPLIDPVGSNASCNQRSGIWFLAGKLADEHADLPSRQCSIPDNTAILFPVMNCEANRLEYPDLDEEGLIRNVTEHMELIPVRLCFINGEEIPVQRVKAEPQIFKLDLAEDNIFDIAKGLTYACADGYWVFLKPLSIGSHEIRFHGSCSGGTRKSGAKYKIYVKNKPEISPSNV